MRLVTPKTGMHKTGPQTPFTDIYALAYPLGVVVLFASTRLMQQTTLPEQVQNTGIALAKALLELRCIAAFCSHAQHAIMQSGSCSAVNQIIQNPRCQHRAPQPR
jgi:hypothetical protein